MGVTPEAEYDMGFLLDLLCDEAVAAELFDGSKVLECELQSNGRQTWNLRTPVVLLFVCLL
jgi:hypothetical protein